MSIENYRLYKGTFENVVIDETVGEMGVMSLEQLKYTLENFQRGSKSSLLEATTISLKSLFEEQKSNVARNILAIVEKQLDYEYIVKGIIQALEGKISKLENGGN